MSLALGEVLLSTWDLEPLGGSALVKMTAGFPALRLLREAVSGIEEGCSRLLPFRIP